VLVEWNTGVVWMGVSGRTVMGTASGGGRESWKEAAFFDTATNRRMHSIPAGWFVQEVLEVPSLAVACGGIIRQSICEDES
jgi:hypothetical protein